MPPVFSMALPMLWLIRAVALAATLLSGWLTLAQWMGPGYSPGCGTQLDCSAVLGSRWSLWFSIPVPLLAATLWLSVLLLTLPTAGRWLGRTADQLLAACAVLLLAGACWFGGLMLVLRLWCPWCIALHAAALFAGAVILTATWKAARQGECGLFCVAGQAGTAGAALLILGQWFGRIPDTHRITHEPISSPIPAAGEVLSAQKIAPGASLPFVPPGSVAYFKNTLVLSRTGHPFLGKPDVPHILASFSDYTCPSCRAQHSDLKALLETYPDTFGVLLLPTPLDRSCNPCMGVQSRSNPDACTLAALALAFWKEDPEHFPRFHDYLMSGPLPLDPALARAEAARIAPHVHPVESAEWIPLQLASNSRIWEKLSKGDTRLPKLVLRDETVLHGSTSSRDRFFEILQETFSASLNTSIPITAIPR